MADSRKGLWASLGELLVQAVASAREEVVERGWFGRVTGDAPAGHEPAAIERPSISASGWQPQSFEEQWAAREKLAPKGPEPDQGHDIDR